MGMRKYEVAAEEYFEKLREDKTPKELGYFFEDFEKPMNQLIERYNIKNKKVLSIGGLFGHEEYYFSINGCNITIVDENYYAMKYLDELDTSENPNLTYIIGNIQEVLKEEANTYDVIYLSGFPQELQWNDKGFSDLILNCINTFLDKGVFICQTYHGGFAMNYPTSIKLLEAQCKQEDLFLEAIYYFELYPAISLVILYKGERETLDINKGSKITQFHGRYKGEIIVNTIYQLGEKFRKMNIIIVSMERCGSSWFGAIISEVYEAIMGELVKWNHEIDRASAIEGVIGWNSVYNVDPHDLLKKGYDKIIVLERNLETVKRVFWTSQRLHHGDFPYEMSLDDLRYVNFFSTIEKYWNLVYGNKSEDPSIKYVHLDDLNSYTFNTFNEVFDFLDFPKSRPIIIPVNPPERNWQCYSDILAKGHRPSDTLRLIDLRYASNISEAQLQTEAIINKTYDANTPNLTNPQYKYANNQESYARDGFRIMINATVDELIETLNCELCHKIFGENENKEVIQEWLVKQKTTTITKCFIVCEKCLDITGNKIIIRDWEKMEEKILDLGCGTDKVKGAFGVDHIEFPRVDYVCDLNEVPWVFGGGSNCWDVIYMTDILEHLENPIKILEEAHRILKIGGKLIITVVYWNHKYSFSDLTHLHAFSEISFKCLVGEGRPLGLEFQFSSIDIEWIYDSRAIEKFGNAPAVLHDKAYHNCNVIQGMIIKLIK